MSSILCRNYGNLHKHSSVVESKMCWGLIAPPSPPVVVAPSVVMVTSNQLRYIRDLGGDVVYAAKLSKVEASAYIDRLLANPTAAPVRPKLSDDPRLPMIQAMLELVPIGYYAVRPDENSKITFLRLARPKVGSRNQYAGATKIQTQHGPRLELEAVLWPSNKWSIYTNASIIDSMLLMISDTRTASLLYATEIGQCMRCNAELTDERSRFYGIGPECETKPGYGWVIEVIDERRGGSYEFHHRRGTVHLITAGI